MYTLLIVEDEPLIRMGLQHYFAWQELGVTRILASDNGKSGLELALLERPDLIITDIRMPEMDGLAMIEGLRGRLPDTVFIILTGFNEFAYAQQAIRLGGVHAFLIKPLEYEESLATIQECMEVVSNRHKKREALAEMEFAVQETKRFRESEWIRLLLEDEPSESFHEEMASSLFGSPSAGCLPFVLTWLPPLAASPVSRNAVKEAAASIIESAISNLYSSLLVRPCMTYLHKNKLYGIAFVHNWSQDEQGLPEGPSEQLIKQAGLTAQASFYLAVGLPTSSIAELGPSMKQADKALLQRYFIPDRHIFMAGSGNGQHDITDITSAALLQLDEPNKKQLLACLENADAEQIKALLQHFAGQHAEPMQQLSPARWLAFLQELISACLQFAGRNGVPYEGVYSDKLLSLAFVDDFPTLEALFEWLGAWMVQLGMMCRQSSLSDSPQDMLIFELIASYIKQHIAEEVTLQMVADRFYYNPSYLSRLFKRKLNKNYMRFVTEIRMAYAQELLKKPDHLVTDICTMCGYKSYKHFVKTFGSLTRMTPTEYRKKWGWA
ncbi:response regulator [Bacillus sp. 3255]|uniref:response regulator n=1 Tax=Bacillus sp. 3255 TaxID=2817904 RepID=UPI002858A3E8|nr:response regulator [Bacillus sp. 3255]MDR6882112.1 two-component system response regulator YesN [Bacillus sp. 3255]